MPELIEPTVELWDSWLESSREASQDGAGLWEADDPTTVEGFAVWVEGCVSRADDSRALAPDRVHATYWWIVEDGNYLGVITLRHALNEKLLAGGGHIGSGVRPSARGRGLVSWTLGQVLDRARARGIDRVLVTCTDDNTASAKTIERNGGVLEDIRETWLGTTRRYWIEL